jgi:transcription termination/antitermination protein NusG
MLSHFDPDEEARSREVDYDADPIYLEDGDDEFAPKHAPLLGDEETPRKRAARRRKKKVADAGLEAEGLESEKPAPVLTAQWYAVHCYSGYENKVQRSLDQRIQTLGMHDKIQDVVVPTQEEIEIRDGKRKVLERRVFPGYVLVLMVLDDDTKHFVRNTPGVTGFVSMGEEPIPLRPEEITQIMRRMEADPALVNISFKVADQIRIIDGPFNDFPGTVDSIDMEKSKVRVIVSFFGRPTPVELDFIQVEKWTVPNVK